MRNSAAAALFVSLCGAVSSLTILMPASNASVRPDPGTEIERVIGREILPLTPPGAAGGLAVAVRAASHTRFFNYGFADQAEKRPVSSDSLFNVGSVRKVFEATLLAEAVLRGEIKLDDPVNTYVTELQGDYIRHVTVGELATHTSGLLLPTDHPPWPTEHYSLAGFLDALNDWTPPNGERPGAQRIYTHAGYVLLQLVLERRFHMPIAELLEERVIKPLGLTSTFVPERGADDRAMLDAPLLRRAVQGYSGEGVPVGLPGNQQGYFDFPGTGQMFSSAHDLSVLLAAYLDETSADPQLRRAMLLTQREAFRVSPQYGQAMAWETDHTDGITIVDKPGGLNNASAYIGLVPERKLGIVLLVNRGDAYPFETARTTLLPELAKLFAPETRLHSSAR
jgi:beta-lactamase class C